MYERTGMSCTLIYRPPSSLSLFNNALPSNLYERPDHQRLQHQQQVQLRLANMIGGQEDKRLRELHAFALEYVKLIVAKADDLSQSHEYLKATTNSSGQPELEQVIRKAAQNINTKFLLTNDGQQVARAPQARTAKQANEARDMIVRPASPEELGQESTEEREPAEVSSGPEEPGKRSRRGRFRRRLNWHLFVSCFSNCLPRTLVETMPSNLGARATNSRCYESQPRSS